MLRRLEAVYEKGVLRPLEPLALAEPQHVHVTITDTAAAESPAPDNGNYRYPDMAWLAAHKREYPGQWLALDGDALLSHGSDAFAVRDTCLRKNPGRTSFNAQTRIQPVSSL